MMDIDRLVQQTSSYQKSILADGRVTSAEYQQAVNAARQCVIDAGFSPGDPSWDRGEYGFGIALTGDDEDSVARLSDEYDVALDSCSRQYSAEVAQVWVLQEVPSEEQRNEMRPHVLACLSEAGITVPSDARDPQIYEAMTMDNLDAWEPCEKKYYQFFIVAPDGSES